MDVVAGLASAVFNAIGSILSKGFTRRYPARQLVAPLLALNVVIVLPLAPFAAWAWSPEIVLLLLLSAAILVASSFAMFDLFDNGTAAAAVTAQSISPLPAAIAVAVLLPGTLGLGQVAGATVVVAAVLYGLTNAFGELGRRRTAGTVLVAAIATGLLTVTARLLADAGAGVIETYLMRTAVASAVSFAIAPPRDIPLRALPGMLPRAAFVAAHFLVILVAVQHGNPAVIQTASATVPLVAVAFEAAQHRRRPSTRVLASATFAAIGVAIVLLA